MIRPLGRNLSAIKIWHDNSGKNGNESSWYLKHIIVHDLQTREKSYFLCEKWLAIDKESDCAIERILSVSSDEDKLKFKYLLSKQTKEKLSDGHLWFSIFARPAQNSFNRLDRLTCCFVLLSISMLMNIMYYGMDTSAKQDNGLQIGPYINLTLQQLSVGLITNLIVFPPTLLLVQLFRRIKPRQTRIEKLKSVLNNTGINDLEAKTKNSEKKKTKKSSFQLKFPWWFKIIAYLISFLFACISIFFVIVKGIEFGNDKVAKWLTSLIISFLSSILLTQPIQVRKIIRINKEYFEKLNIHQRP